MNKYILIVLSAIMSGCYSQQERIGVMNVPTDGEVIGNAVSQKIDKEETIVGADTIEYKADSKEIAKAVNRAGMGDRAYHHSTYNGKIYYHNNYFLSYSEQDEQAEWVAYELTKEEVKSVNTAKCTQFPDDPIIATGSASALDYKYTGYDKGHLAPSADMRFDDVAQKECYYMSNMSPQLHAFNAGIWNDLENYVRSLAVMYGRVYVVTGPVLKGCNRKLVKKFNDGTEQETRVTVPEYFFKIVFDYSKADKVKMIAFVMPNKGCKVRDIFKYATTVDKVEKMTGVDFFKNLPRGVQAVLESRCDESEWMKFK